MNRGRLLRTLLLLLVSSTILGFAAVVGYRPERLPTEVAIQVDRLTEAVGVRTAILAAGAILACIGLLGSWAWRTDDQTAELSELSPEQPDREVDVTGADLTAVFESTRDSWLGIETVEESLRTTLIDLYGRKFDGREQAKRHVDNGAWTDDQVAAATLTTTDSVDFPLLYRLYAWLYPDHAHSYRTRRTLRAVEDTCAVELMAYSPPERRRGWLGRLSALLDSGGDQQ
ncbi:hypothetical protein EKH57_16030 [Halorubrum sp. BOL3-1]|uniref:DUF7269 family protein n=1 Tax=Halorubrum sp. BOL3-1 TaxID=2497325 RepID=UPI001004E803|nr:hypothetical protein [Halorubrum sp. BOL3-1]QAU14082.1 hypothetical protein EKH57_16030 [Halorubrum sp. BOL3-1]